jgi:hypothetical protein
MAFTAQNKGVSEQVWALINPESEELRTIFFVSSERPRQNANGGTD